MDLKIAPFFIRISRPLYLLSGALVYALGAGIARYLGYTVDWGLYALGQIWVTALQLGAHYLGAYYLLPVNPKAPGRIPLSNENDEPAQGIRRDVVLWAAFAALAATTSITLMLIRVAGTKNGATLLMMGMIFLATCVTALPQFRLATTGYGEIVLSIVMANLIPAFGFMLQRHELHRLVAMSTFPLTMLHLAMSLAFQLPGYLQDVKARRNTLLVRLGWERGMILHNFLILGAFVLIGLAMLFGLSPAVALPVFFVLPLGLFQIWYMTRIAAGAKPNWKAQNLMASLTFGLTVYLLVLNFWTH